MPVYFNQDPVLNAGGLGGFGGFFGGGPQIPGIGQNTTPMATRLPLSPWDPFNVILNWNDLDAGKAAKTDTNQQ